MKETTTKDDDDDIGTILSHDFTLHSVIDLFMYQAR